LRQAETVHHVYDVVGQARNGKRVLRSDRLRAAMRAAVEGYEPKGRAIAQEVFEEFERLTGVAAQSVLKDKG
jgi:hypothetical protein